MRKTTNATLAALALLLAALGACGGGGGSDGGSDTAVAGTATGTTGTTYDGGHSLTVTTDDAATLSNEAEIVRLVNERRIAIGKNALVQAGNIGDVARGHSRHMIEHSFFAHENPEGYTPGERLTTAGISWTMAGENLAAGYSTPETTFNAWMASPGHKENIERDGWTHTGVGYQEDGGSAYTWYWTQNFIKL